MLGKGVGTFKRDMAKTPLQPMHGEKKHTREPRFICANKILELKVSLPNIDILQILDSLTIKPHHLLLFDQKLSNRKKMLVLCWEEMWQHLNILNINLLPEFKVLLTQHYALIFPSFENPIQKTMCRCNY